MIWLLGSQGMLASFLAKEFLKRKIPFAGTDHKIDISNFNLLRDFADSYFSKTNELSAIINCAAYTNVDKAEQEKDLAYRINVTGAKNLAIIAKNKSVPLIHISTDYVFGNNVQSKLMHPYTEDAITSPVNFYGITKDLGEKEIQNELQNFYILRSSWLYSYSGKNFVKTMLSLLKSHSVIKVVADQKGSPTFCKTLSDSILKILERNNSCSRVPNGIYHISDEGECSWYEFAVEIKKLALDFNLLKNDSCKIIPCTTNEYPQIAKRPDYSVLSKEKIKKNLNLKIPDWKESLYNFFTMYP